MVDKLDVLGSEVSVKTCIRRTAIFVALTWALLGTGAVAYGQCNKDQVQVSVRKFDRDTSQIWKVKFNVKDTCSEKVTIATLFIDYSYEYKGSDGRLIKTGTVGSGTISPSQSHSTVIETNIVVPENCEVTDVYVDSVRVTY